MNIIKVSVKTGTKRYWVGYFDSIPTLEKIREVVYKDLRRCGRDVLKVLKVAEPVMVTRRHYGHKSANWCTPVIIAGTQIGIIEYKKMMVHSLKNDEQVKGFTNMNSIYFHQKTLRSKK